MAIQPRPTRLGSPNAAEIYLSVGLALSWWEASEDILMGVFKWLCGKGEPTAFETYVATSRSVRDKMLLSTLTRYEKKFLPEELKEIRSALKALDKLSPMRNQIAHGHVSKANMTRDGHVVMDGNFLVPSLNEAGHNVPRDFRYAHAASEIDAWRDAVRTERGRIMDAEMAAQMREQNDQMALSMDARMTMATAEAIAYGHTSPEDHKLLYVEKPGGSEPI